MNVDIEIRWRIGLQEAREVDPALFRLLSDIEQGCSLREAATNAGMSYRHAWGLMQSWQQALGEPFAKLERGRGASISPLGRSVLWADRRAHARLAPILGSIAAEAERELGSLLAGTSPVRALASHDLALSIMRDHFNALGGPRLSLQHLGSEDCVRQLAAGQCEIAGFHLPDGPLGSELEASFRRMLHPDRFSVLLFVHRQQGLMVAPGNPLGIRGLADLGRREVTFINRQPGSGTRLLLDLMLAERGIRGADIAGYETEEFTHLAVAAMVASGAVTTGFGVEAAAARFGLDFVPLVRERYLLAFARSSPEPAWLPGLMRILRGPELRKALGGLPGYDAGGMGSAVDLARGPRPADQGEKNA
jgi:putative molybdopterin biosynthesis protein